MTSVSFPAKTIPTGYVLRTDHLSVVPITLKVANDFIQQLHRHNKPVPGCKFCVAVALNERIVGVAVAGRPVARMSDDGWALEVNRTCTDSTKNTNSKLYGAVLRAAWALGYRRVITYSLPEESGSSLKAVGFRLIGEAGGGSWSRKERPRVDFHPTLKKLRWEACR